MKKKLRFLIGSLFCLVLLCLGFSFCEPTKTSSITANAISETVVQEAFATGQHVEKGGAIYLASGSNYKMSGGTLRGHYAEKGGAIYIGNNATFTMTGGTISGNYALYGGAIYVAAGGTCNIKGGTITGNFGQKAPAIYVEDGGELNIEDSAVVENNLYVRLCNLVEVYVDGLLSKTIKTNEEIFVIDESEMPLDYEHCCGYFLDEKLSKCSFGEVDLTQGDVCLYTKTASDLSNFTFTYNQITQTYDIDGSASGDIVLPKEYNNVQISIGTSAWRHTDITTIVISEGVTIIGYEAFSESSLTGNLIIPDSVTSIDDYAFCYCYISGVLIIPERVISIGQGAFESCWNITGFEVCEGNAIYEDKGKNAIVKISSQELIRGCNYTDLTILEDIISIGENAFVGCSSLIVGSLIIPDNIKNIGKTAFGYSDLLSVYVPSVVTTIYGSEYYYSPFYGASSNFVIYTDVQNTNSKPSGWGTFWNYRTSNATYTTKYGYSLAQYKEEAGVTFAQEQKVENDNLLIELENLEFADDYKLEAILNNKNKYIALLKENEKVA